MLIEKPIIVVGVIVSYDWLSLVYDLTSLAKEIGSVPRGTGTGQTKGIAIGRAFKKQETKAQFSHGNAELSHFILIDQ